MRFYKICNADGKGFLFTARNDQEAIKYVIDHSYRFSVWSVLRNDIGHLYREDANGFYFLAASIDLNAKVCKEYYAVGHWSAETPFISDLKEGGEL